MQMKPIHERTQWHEHTSIERCQETGRPVEVYSLKVEKALVWDSMTQEERLKLFRVNQLINIGALGLTADEKKEYLALSNWMEYNGVSLFDIPDHVKGAS